MKISTISSICNLTRFARKNMVKFGVGTLLAVGAMQLSGCNKDAYLEPENTKKDKHSLDVELNDSTRTYNYNLNIKI